MFLIARLFVCLCKHTDLAENLSFLSRRGDKIAVRIIICDFRIWILRSIQSLLITLTITKKMIFQDYYHHHYCELIPINVEQGSCFVQPSHVESYFFHAVQI